MKIKKYMLKEKNILFFLPSLITCSSILCGLWAIFICFANEKLEIAILLIALAGCFDAVDGRFARWLKQTGKFGIELDSLADFLSFGVAPMIIFYNSYPWNDDLKAFSILSIFPICMALRLARFNLLAMEPTAGNIKLANFQKNFFFGLAAPVGAIALLLPIIASSLNIFTFACSNCALLYAFIIALLLVIPIPIFSHKFLHFGFKTKKDIIFTLSAFISFLFFLYYPMYCLIILSGLYCCTIPISIIFYNYKKRKLR